MNLLYRFAIGLYGIAIHIAAVFHPKARKWVEGRRHQVQDLQGQQPQTNRKTIWFHCASLGEFEQGRPVLEALRKEHPKAYILLTFFSPSGYEIRKDYPYADKILYLPLDTPRRAKRFIGTFEPDAAVFVKYEFWYFYLRELKRRDIPIFLISAVFRENQWFFKFYGSFFTQMLGWYKMIFVQDNASLNLLRQKGFDRCIQSGDTRFDRVVQIARKPKKTDIASRFARGQKVIVAGSTWPEDEQILIPYIRQSVGKYRWIIAPHEIGTAHLEAIQKGLGSLGILFSQADQTDFTEKEVLVIDNVGMLSSLYALGQIAYIGGGFGRGIHNILEAAVYGIPVIFGPNYTKFREALALIEQEGATSVSKYAQLAAVLDHFYDHPEAILKAGRINREFVLKNAGATQEIVNNMLTFL